MWNNWADDGERDLRTHHRGEKVTCPDAEKIGLNAWFHGEKKWRAPRPSRTPREHTARESAQAGRATRSGTSAESRLG